MQVPPLDTGLGRVGNTAPFATPAGKLQLICDCPQDLRLWCYPAGVVGTMQTLVRMMCSTSVQAIGKKALLKTMSHALTCADAVQAERHSLSQRPQAILCAKRRSVRGTDNASTYREDSALLGARTC